VEENEENRRKLRQKYKTKHYARGSIAPRLPFFCKRRAKNGLESEISL